MEERFSRHWDLIDVERLHNIPIKIIGSGSVGSFTCLTLAKMGAHNIEVWDDDMVDEVNISNQFFRMGDIGEYKVEALQSIINSFEGVPIVTHAKKATGKENLNGIVITALDSMLARKRIWDKIKNEPGLELFIDPRMGGRVARIYSVISPAGKEEYEKTLYPDDDAAPERCTERTILYNVLGISSLISKLIEDYLMKERMENFKEIILDYATYTLITNNK